MPQAALKTPPKPLAPVPFNVPQAKRTTLENGLRVVIIEDARVPLVSFRLAFLSGDADDPAGSVGQTSALAAMLTEGTQNYSSRALAEKIERLGAGLSASASDDFTIVSATALALYTSEILQLIAEIVFKPTFPENELDLYRRNTVEHLKFQRSQANFLAGEQTARILYGSHPYSRVSPTAAEVERITSEDLASLHRSRFVANNAVLIVVGDVEHDLFLNDIREHFGEWRQGPVEQRRSDRPKALAARKLTIVDRPGSAQSNIVLANLAIRRNDPDYFPLLVMNQVLGAGASSRVFMNLREEKGYTYGAYTRIDARKDSGDIEATAEVRTAVTGDSLKEFFYELERIRNEKVSPEELADAKNFLTGVFPIRAETQEGLTNLILSQELHGLPADYLNTYRDKVNAVNAADVARAASKYISPGQMSIVIVGDAGEILEQARDHADDVELFDTEGNQIDLAEYEARLTGEAASFSGVWKLGLDFQGQEVPVTLTIEQSGNSVSGKIETALGDGEITAGSVRGDSLSATANTEIQGQSVEFVINGKLEGEAISGTISAAVIPDSLPFKGSRA
ncbi:MAG: insulinase family protein [Acidobacteria bacterium]|nr:insulinase family protein [Acidobacteriota bacterium]